MLLEYERRTRFPTRRGNIRLYVEDDGQVYFQRNDSDPPPGAEWTHGAGEPVKRLSDPARLIAKLLDRGGFFKLPPRIENQNSTDGTIEQLTYHGAQGPKTVILDRARDERFRKLVRRLASEFGVLDSL